MFGLEVLIEQAGHASVGEQEGTPCAKAWIARDEPASWDGGHQQDGTAACRMVARATTADRAAARSRFPWDDGAMSDPDQRDPTTGQDEDSAYDLLQRGRALMRGRHNAQAAIVLERAARLEPGKGSILESLGRAYFNSGQLTRALETFQQLLDVDPSSAFAYYALGRTLVRLGRPDEARGSLRIAVALDPASDLYANALRRLSSRREGG
jgi:Flp pilus assembly protein TadD